MRAGIGQEERSRKIVSCRITIKQTFGETGQKRITFCELNEYGVMIDNRTILVGDRFFHAGRKAGFGKSGTTIVERINNKVCTVRIDRIEEYIPE